MIAILKEEVLRSFSNLSGSPHQEWRSCRAQGAGCAVPSGDAVNTKNGCAVNTIARNSIGGVRR